MMWYTLHKGSNLQWRTKFTTLIVPYNQMSSRAMGGHSSKQEDSWRSCTNLLHTRLQSRSWLWS